LGGSGQKHLPRVVLSDLHFGSTRQLAGGKAAAFVVDQRQQLIGDLRVASIDGGEDSLPIGENDVALRSMSAASVLDGATDSSIKHA
jgi:hypothetical protein